MGLSNQTGEAPSLRPWSPRAPRTLPVPSTCRSGWCNWYTALLLCSPVFGVSGDATHPCSPPCSGTSPGGRPLARHTAKDKMSPPNIHLRGGGGSSVWVPTIEEPERPPIAPGTGPRSWGGLGGVGEGAVVPSARRAAETPKQSPLDGSTPQKSFRLVSVRVAVSVPSPRTPSPLPSPNLCSFGAWFCFLFFFFFYYYFC